MRTLGSRCRDAGSFDAGWLTKVVVLLAVLGLVLMDSVSVVTARLSVADDASTAAVAGRDSYAAGRNVMVAYAAATKAATDLHPDTMLPAKEFVVAPNGAVTVTAVRTPSTIVAHYLPWVRDHLQQQATEAAVPAT